MKEEKQDKPKAPRGPQPTVEEREIRAVLVAVIRDSQNPATAMEYLDELEFLAETADIKTVKGFLVRGEHIEAKTLKEAKVLNAEHRAMHKRSRAGAGGQFRFHALRQGFRLRTLFGRPHRQCP